MLSFSVTIGPLTLPPLVVSLWLDTARHVTKCRGCVFQALTHIVHVSFQFGEGGLRVEAVTATYLGGQVVNSAGDFSFSLGACFRH